MKKRIEAILKLENEFDAAAEKDKELKREYKKRLFGMFLIFCGLMLFSQFTPEIIVDRGGVYETIKYIVALFVYMYITPLAIKLWVLDDSKHKDKDQSFKVE